MSYKRTQELMVKKVTSDEAKLFLKYNNFEGQRALNQNKVNIYAQQMTNKTMRPVDIDIATSPTGIKYLMNGQHVCNAIIQSNIAYDARVQYWKCDTDEDLWHLFATFDVHAARTEMQIIKGARKFLGGIADVPLHILRACSSAMHMLSTNPPDFSGGRTVSKTTKVDFLANTKNHEIVLWVASLASECGSERQSIMRTPAITAMIATYKANKAKADTFWKRVCNGAMLERSSNEYRLGHILLYGRCEKSCIGGGSRNKNFYCISVLYWNSWIKNELRHSVKLASLKTIPDVLS